MISQRLDSATLQAQIPVCEFPSGDCSNVAVNVTWTASGTPFQPDPSIFMCSDSSSLSLLSQTGVAHPAQLSGAATNGSVDFLQGQQGEETSFLARYNLFDFFFVRFGFP